MLRIYVLQHLYNLADDAARNEIIDSRAFSQFCGVDSSNQVPDMAIPSGVFGIFSNGISLAKRFSRMWSKVCRSAI